MIRIDIPLVVPDDGRRHLGHSPGCQPHSVQHRTGAERSGIQSPSLLPSVQRKTSALEIEPLSPDLLVLPPQNLTLQSLPSRAGGPFLRFVNSVANISQGPLELRADTGAVREGFVVTQRVYNSQGEVSREQDGGK